MSTGHSGPPGSGRRNRRRLRQAAVGAPLLALGLAAAACGGSSSSSTTTTSSGSSSTTGSGGSSSTATVHVASVPGVGSVLVNAQGRTLYLFTPDKQSTPTCSGACASAWPALVVTGSPTPGTGVAAGMLGTVTGANGTIQVTYNHWPLYTFVGDTAAGQAKGQGLNTFGGHWSALTASGSMANPASSSATTTTKAGSGGYGY